MTQSRDALFALLATVPEPVRRPDPLRVWDRHRVEAGDEALAHADHLLQALRPLVGNAYGPLTGVMALAVQAAAGKAADLVVLEVPCWQIGRIVQLATATVREALAGLVALPGVLHKQTAFVAYRAKRKVGDPRGAEGAKTRIAGLRFTVKIPEAPLSIEEALDFRRMGSRVAPLVLRRDLSLAVHERDTEVGCVERVGKAERACRGRSRTAGTGVVTEVGLALMAKITRTGVERPRVRLGVQGVLELLAKRPDSHGEGRSQLVRAVARALAAECPESDVRGWLKVAWDALKVTEAGVTDGFALLREQVRVVFVQGQDAPVRSKARWLMRRCLDALAGPLAGLAALRSI